MTADSGPTRAPRVAIMARHVNEQGGIAVFTRKVVPLLIELTPDIDFHILVATAEQADFFSSATATVVLLPARSRFIWDQWSVPQYARRAGIDVVFNCKLSIPLAGRFKKGFFLPGAEQLVVPHVFPLMDRLYTHTMMPLYARRADIIITCTETGKDDIVKHLQVDPRHVLAVPLGVPSWFAPASASDVAALRARYALPEQFVLFVGGLTPLKNLGHLLHAFTLLADLPRLHLVLAGFRRWRFEAELSLIDRLGLRSRVREIGFVPDADLPGLYSAAGCLALPSWYEGFGIPVVEAMSCGCPVVCTDRGCSPEVAGDAAVLVDPASPASIADGIRRALRHGPLRAACVERGLARASHFRWEHTAGRVAEAVRSLAHSHHSAAAQVVPSP